MNFYLSKIDDLFQSLFKIQKMALILVSIASCTPISHFLHLVFESRHLLPSLLLKATHWPSIKNIYSFKRCTASPNLNLAMYSIQCWQGGHPSSQPLEHPPSFGYIFLEWRIMPPNSVWTMSVNKLQSIGMECSVAIASQDTRLPPSSHQPATPRFQCWHPSWTGECSDTTI